jgi:hypothetical protein
MKTIRTLPPKLWPIRDAAIERALKKAPPTPDFQKLYDWLLNEGYEELCAAYNDKFAIDLKWLAKLRFSDLELRAYCELGKGKKVTDAMRCSFARQIIGDMHPGDDPDTVFPSIEALKLERGDGKSAVIGCTSLSIGQGGPEFDCHGIFATEADFLAHLRSLGFWLDDPAKLSDKALLSLWRTSEE